ncbi:MAG: ATP-binding protein [Herbinix sp.]|nr:ATP-binding protein [Herbinix sp.]
MSYIGYVFYSYLTDFSKIWIVFWGIMNVPPVKKKNVYIIAVMAQSILLIIAGNYYKEHPDQVAVFWTAMVIIAVCYLFEGKFFKKIAYSLLAYILVLLLDACLAGICSAVAINVGNKFMHLLFNITSVIILGIFVWLKRRKNKSLLQINISRKIYALLFAGSGTGVILVSGLLVRSNNKTSEAARKVIIIVTIIVVISYCSVCLMMVLVTESRDNYKALSMINQSVIESQQQYYMLVNDKQQEIRSIKHEMKNHFACINGLYKANKHQEMEQYISQLIEDSNMSTDLFDTGNDIVNAILNDAQSRYRKDLIAIRLEGGFPQKFNIAPMDLCVIFANIISNAVEAIQRMDRKDESFAYVDVKISSFKNDLYIDVKNPIGNNIEVQNGRLITSKKDNTLHGFGVKNVIQRVEKYQGTYNFGIQNNYFFIEINMKI